MKCWECLHRKCVGGLFDHSVSALEKACFFYFLFFCIPPPDEFKAFLTRLPQNFYLNASAIHHLWLLDGMFQRRYELLESTMKSLFRRAQRVVYKLFSLSKRCEKQPLIKLPHERWAQPLCYLLIKALWHWLTANSGMG